MGALTAEYLLVALSLKLLKEAEAEKLILW